MSFFGKKSKYFIPLGVALFFTALWATNRVFSMYVIFIVSLIGVYIVAASSLNLTNGYTGLFSLGHAGFMAVGAYTAALLTFPVQMREVFALAPLPKWLGGSQFQWPFFPALPARALSVGRFTGPHGAHHRIRHESP
jgi:branched-chain amino acid transport system permease protein